MPLPALLSPNQNPDNRAVRFMQAAHGPPAFAKRAQDTQREHDRLLDQCRRRRSELLRPVRIKLGWLYELSAGWERLQMIHFTESRIAVIRSLYANLRPRLRVPVPPTRSARALERAVNELKLSIENFNKYWRRFLHGVDLSLVNARREEYNRNYLLEKECLVGSPRIARMGYVPLPPIRMEDLQREFPLLGSLES